MIVGDVLSNESDTYSGKCTLYIDALAEDKRRRMEATARGDFLVRP